MHYRRIMTATAATTNSPAVAARRPAPLPFCVGDGAALVEDPEVEDGAAVTAVSVVGGPVAIAPIPPVAAPVKDTYSLQMEGMSSLIESQIPRQLLTGASFTPMAVAADWKSLKLPVPLEGALIVLNIPVSLER